MSRTEEDDLNDLPSNPWDIPRKFHPRQAVRRQTLTTLPQVMDVWALSYNTVKKKFGGLDQEGQDAFLKAAFQDRAALEQDLSTANRKYTILVDKYNALCNMWKHEHSKRFQAEASGKRGRQRVMLGEYSDREERSPEKLNDPEEKSSTMSTQAKKQDLLTFETSQPIVAGKVSLDDSSKEFLVHQPFLCFYSPYFTAALKGPFQEGQSQTVHLEEMCPTAFSIFVNWLYCQRIEKTNKEPLLRENLLELWLLADRLNIPKLQNEAMSILGADAFPDTDDIHGAELCRKFERMYDNTMDESPLRRFFLDRLTCQSNVKLVPEQNIPKQMLMDMLNLARPDLEPYYGRNEYGVSRDFFVEEK